jgi:dihydroorotase
MPMSFQIVNGRVIDPRSGLDATADVTVVDGRIKAITPSATRRQATTSGEARIIDAAGKLVVPGLIDPHVHLREPGQEHKETLAMGSVAAVAGGFTTLCCMPNTNPSLDDPEHIRFIYDSARRTAKCRVFPVGALTRARKGEDLAEIQLMHKAGAVGFSDDGDGVASAGMMARCLAAVKQTGKALMQHAQEPTLTRGSSMHAGAIATKLGLTGWPSIAEELMVERDIRLNRGIGCRYHVQHVSSDGTVELIREARRRGEPVSGEASPHHLLLTHEACDGYNTMAKMNPPLREKRDVEALVKGVADGTITVLATDHAPHSSEEKSQPFEEAPFGIIGLETALALYIDALITPGVIDWPRLIALLTIEPAKLCGLDGEASAHRDHPGGLGQLSVGGPADITIIDPDLAWTIGEHDLVGKSRNTPFLGRRVKGRAVMTMVGGRVEYEATGV